MNPITVRKFKLLGEFCFITAFAGIVYQLLRYGHVNHNALIMGGGLGFGFGIIELFILSGFRKKFSQLPFFATIFLKALIYFIIINIVSGVLGFIIGYLQGRQIEEFFIHMLHKNQLILVIYTLIVYVLLSFYIQINLLLGEGVLLKFLLGRYRKPTGEHRIFMFLDIKSSTTLAEKLGLERYYSFLNDFFHEISEPTRITNAEIYQYVGDEVVFTWKTNEGLSNSNCLRIFYEIRENVNRNKKYYIDKYGGVPDFKAGLHYGKVISAQIGDIKREIVYNGDVLNTSARIQEQCNIFDRELLISGKLLNRLDIKEEYLAEKIDTVRLRGKISSIELYSLVKFKKQNST
jgi:adenylate cyclase